MLVARLPPRSKPRCVPWLVLRPLQRFPQDEEPWFASVASILESILLQRPARAPPGRLHADWPERSSRGTQERRAAWSPANTTASRWPMGWRLDCPGGLGDGRAGRRNGSVAASIGRGAPPTAPGLARGSRTRSNYAAPSTFGSTSSWQPGQKVRGREDRKRRSQAGQTTIRRIMRQLQCLSPDRRSDQAAELVPNPNALLGRYTVELWKYRFT